MVVVGISAYYHDSAAVLLRGGELVAAAQEERFTRRKHDAAFPRQALAYCLAEAGLTLADVDRVVFYEKPLVKFERLLETWLAFAPRGFGGFSAALPQWLTDKLFLKARLLEELGGIGSFEASRLGFSEHHRSHAASAFLPSPFEEAVVLTVDGVGEWETTTLGMGRGDRVELQRALHFPHSLGLLYSAFTGYCGFRVNSGEYKLMGLAPYGKPVYADRIRDHLIDIKSDGSFALDLDYFGWCTGLTMTSEPFHRLFDGEPRPFDAEPTQREMDLAASVQRVLEEVLDRIVRDAVAGSGVRNLCLAGGVALNCVANGRLLRERAVDALWVQPAAGDAGGALGAALVGSSEAGTPRQRNAMAGSRWGPGFSDADVAERLAAAGAVVERPANLDAEVVAALDAGDVVGWFQGRMEYGPRALGGRSILADPRRPEMKDRVNALVKLREGFRPFAPAVLRERLSEWFELDADTPFMTLTAQVRAPTPLPAITHVDGSSRVQSVHVEHSPRFHRLLSAWEAHTGCPVLLNTSFNVRGEPIVCTPEEAWNCFRGTGIDALAIGPYWLRREAQDPALLDTGSALALD